MIIFDLDGTLRNLEHRLHLIEPIDQADWDAFYLACGDDAPIDHMLGTLKQFSDLGHTIEIWSGCSEIARDITLDWLGRHGVWVRGQPSISVDFTYFGTGSCAVVDALLMRGAKDFTRDVELKQRWLTERWFTERGLLTPPEQVEMVFDDRKKVVEMWRSHGIPTIHVAPGEF